MITAAWSGVVLEQPFMTGIKASQRLWPEVTGAFLRHQEIGLSLIKWQRGLTLAPKLK